MVKLPPLQNIFPANNSKAILWFWTAYWFWFFIYLPVICVRQLFIILRQTFFTLLTWNQHLSFLDGKLKLFYLNSWKTLLPSCLFGERFFMIQYEDLLIDPGPACVEQRVLSVLSQNYISAIICTHLHEEHIGNAATVAAKLKIPIYASNQTLQEILHPSQLSYSRAWFIGQAPSPSSPIELKVSPPTLSTTKVNLTAIESPGHCMGHFSFYDERQQILFAGDSFMHEVFTSPNGDVDSYRWRETIETYFKLKIRILLDGHGNLYTQSPQIPKTRGVVIRRDPNTMMRDKMAFTQWALAVVKEGEKRGLPYGVIEACLFPWNSRWAWQNWFTDESIRLFSCGEFSRTHFIRSLSQTPEKVPARFKHVAIFLQWLGRVLKWNSPN